MKIRNFYKVIDTYLKSKNDLVPLYIIGNPGIGKTEIIKEYAFKNNYEPIILKFSDNNKLETVQTTIGDGKNIYDFNQNYRLDEIFITDENKLNFDMNLYVMDKPLIYESLLFRDLTFKEENYYMEKDGICKKEKEPIYKLLNFKELSIRDKKYIINFLNSEYKSSKRLYKANDYYLVILFHAIYHIDEKFLLLHLKDKKLINKVKELKRDMKNCEKGFSAIFNTLNNIKNIIKEIEDGDKFLLQLLELKKQKESKEEEVSEINID